MQSTHLVIGEITKPQGVRGELKLLQAAEDYCIRFRDQRQVSRDSRLALGKIYVTLEQRKSELYRLKQQIENNRPTEFLRSPGVPARRYQR